MIRNLQQSVLLRIQAKTGLTVGFALWLGAATGAALMVFFFLCVTAYSWVSVQLGPVFGGLAMAGVFLLIALIGTAASVLSRRQTKQHATLERAVQARGVMTLLDPKVLNVAMQAGRALGWQRLIPLALLGFLAAQWVQEARHKDTPRSD
jgi:hypothetical protein